MASRAKIVITLRKTKYAGARRNVTQTKLGYEVVKQVMEQMGLKWVDDGMGIEIVPWWCVMISGMPGPCPRFRTTSPSLPPF